MNPVSSIAPAAAAPVRATPTSAPAAKDALIAGLFTPAGLLMAILIAAPFVALFFRWFVFQNKHSLGAMEDWGHVYFIPLISGYMIWRDRERLAAIPAETFWPALLPLLLGITTYFMCVVGIQNHMLQGWAIILTIFALCLLLLGPAMMRYLFLPIAFLVFGITVSELIMIKITQPLQLIAAEGAWLLMNMIGLVSSFSVDVAGSTLQIITSSGEKIPLDVAQACSGLRMLVAFVALGAMTALLGCREWWQRVAVVMLAVPVALLLNVVRVAVLGLLSMADAKLIEGEAHTFIGTILLIPGLGLFMGTVWALKRLVRDPLPLPEGGGRGKGSLASRPRPSASSASKPPA